MKKKFINNKRFNFLLSEELFSNLEKISLELGIDKSSIIRLALNNFIIKNKRRKDV